MDCLSTKYLRVRTRNHLFNCKHRDSAVSRNKSRAAGVTCLPFSTIQPPACKKATVGGSSSNSIYRNNMNSNQMSSSSKNNRNNRNSLNRVNNSNKNNRNSMNSISNRNNSTSMN